MECKLIYDLQYKVYCPVDEVQPDKYLINYPVPGLKISDGAGFKNMRILFVNNFYSTYGGAEKIMHNQASLLAQNGHKVDFFTGFTDFKKLNSLETIKILPKIFYNSESESSITNLINKTKPDIVHCHNIYYHLTPSVISACKKANIPVIMTLHDPRMMCPGGTMMLKQHSYCCREYCIKGNPLYGVFYKCRNSSIRESFLSALEYSFNRLGKFYDYVSLFICPSRAIYNLAEKSGIKSNRLIVLNHFVDDELLQNPPDYSSKNYFLYIGRLAKEKGVHYLIEAAKFLPKNIEFHIIGSGPEEEYLKRKSSPNVKFKGYLSGHDLKQEFNGCIATILPCNWFETFGLTIAESFAYGKPVIGSRIGAIPELVTEKIDGLLFDPGNSQQLSHLIYKLYKERPLATLMGKNARQKAEKFFNSSFHYKNLIKVYNSVNSGLN